MVTCRHEGSAEVGKAMCDSTKVAALSFTGSTRVGKVFFQKRLSIFMPTYNLSFDQAKSCTASVQIL